MDEGGLLAGSYKICEARLGNRRLSVRGPTFEEHGWAFLS